MGNDNVAGHEEIVAGLYPLGALVARPRRGVVHETEFAVGDRTVPAVIKIMEVEVDEAEDLIQRLKSAAQFAHPNLLRIYASGSSTWNDVPVVYVVIEKADESLEAVLAERALTGDETREMLAPALDGLDFLHGNGYAHSHLKPSNVLAVNDQLKLSTDSAIPAGVGGAAEDMRALGVLIVQVLTRKTPKEGWESQDFDGIPQPLADIVRHCLDSNSTTRWTVEQVKARLHAPVPAPHNIAVEEPDNDPKAGVPKWIFAALAALILIVVLIAATRKSGPDPVVNPATTSTTNQRNLQAPVTEPVVAAPVSARTDNRIASGWSVIVAAYRSRELAEKRKTNMAKRWPRFDIAVTESNAEKTPYQVVLGRNLSQDQAKALRARALQAGLPRDTYIKRVK